MATGSEAQFGMYACIKGLAARGYTPDCVLDIGAALGEWTGMVMRFWPRTRYFLFEPLLERQPALDALCKAHPNVDYILAGAADRPGRLPLGLTTENLYASSFAYAGQENRFVDVVTVDDLLRQGRFPQPQFMKLDVQGFEHKVLRGGSEAMRRCDLILLELQFYRFAPTMMLMHESIQWMAERDFLPYEFADFLRRPYDGAMGQCDLLFVRKDHWLASSNRWA